MLCTLSQMWLGDVSQGLRPRASTLPRIAQPALVHTVEEEPSLCIWEMEGLRFPDFGSALHHSFWHRRKRKKKIQNRTTIFFLQVRQKSHQPSVAAARKTRGSQPAAWWSPSDKGFFSFPVTPGWHSNPSYLVTGSSHTSCFRAPLIYAKMRLIQGRTLASLSEALTRKVFSRWHILDHSNF